MEFQPLKDLAEAACMQSPLDQLEHVKQPSRNLSLSQDSNPNIEYQFLLNLTNHEINVIDTITHMSQCENEEDLRKIQKKVAPTCERHINDYKSFIVQNFIELR